MSLTTGRGPFSGNPAGHFDPHVPREVVYVEPFLRRVRAVSGTRTVIDSERVVLVHRIGRSPIYAFPESDVPRDVTATAEPAVPGYVHVPWNAVSAWYEEEEQVFGHPRNPYHRIDCIQARRRVRVEVAGALLVDTTDVVGLYEASRGPTLYVRRQDIRMDLLISSPTTSYCPYKARASYWTAVVEGQVVEDLAWSYDDPRPECSPIAGLLSFYPERSNNAQDILTWFSAPQGARNLTGVP